MIRRHRSLLIPLLLVAIWLLAPDLVYADNCSSLNDCYYTLRAALAAAVGLGVFSALMAIGLDVGPFAGNLKKRLGGAEDGGDTAGAAGAVDLSGADVDTWNRSLGVVSISGLVTPPASTAATPAPRQAAAPGSRTGDRTADAMRDAEPVAGTGDRTADSLRETAPQTGRGRRAPEFDVQQPPSAEPAPDVPGAADHAKQATQVAGEPSGASDTAGARDMGTQAQASGPESPPGARPPASSETASTQGQSPTTGAGDEGTRALDQGQRAKSVPDQAPAASEQGRPPSHVSEAPRMRQADGMDQAAPRADRTPDQARGDVPDAPGRRGEPSVSPPPSGEPPGDVAGEGVADRAHDVADAFEPAADQRMAQAEPPPDEQMAQAQRPAPPGGERMAQTGAPQAGRPSPPQAAKPAGAEPPVSAAAEGAPAQGSPPQGDRAAAGQASAPGSPAQAPLAQGARDLARAYNDLARVPGMRLLLQQVAYHGRWAAHAAAAQLTIARRLGRRGAELAQLAHRGRGADILIDGGPAIEVKDYYWRGPFFQSEENVAAATRRLVRQAELLRRRYPQREVQLAFSDPRHVPRQMRIVLQSVGVELAPGVEATAGLPADVAGASLIERLRRTTAEQYLQDLASCGWQVDDRGLQVRVRDAFAVDPIGAWLACAVVAFDAESIYETNPLGESYAAHLRALGLASGGAFRPENAAERVQGQTHHLRFMHAERPYEVATPSATDLVAQAFLDTINSALAQSGATRRFWALPSPDQMLYLAFVSEEVAQRTVEAGLVPGPEEERA